MANFSDWPRERRDVPPELLPEAATNPNGYVAAIDASQVGDPDSFVPAEAVEGVFLVGADGRPTGEFLRNPAHGPVRDDFTGLTSGDSWLGWLPGEPASAVREAIEHGLRGQVSGTMVPWIKVVDRPEFLTGGRPVPDSDEMVVTRAGLVIAFALCAVPPGSSPDVLTGCFTWVASGLDAPPEQRRDRTWFDLGVSVAQGADLLESRIYDV